MIIKLCLFPLILGSENLTQIAWSKKVMMKNLKFHKSLATTVVYEALYVIPIWQLSNFGFCYNLARASSRGCLSASALESPTLKKAIVIPHILRLDKQCLRQKNRN